MLRLLAFRGSNLLWDCSHILNFKRRSSSFLLVTTASPHFPRFLSSEIPLSKDAVQIKEEKSEETVDLDRWKAVMKSQPAFEEKQATIEAEDSDDGENLQEPGGDLEEGSSLEATRDLVVMWRHAGKLVPREMTDEEVETLSKHATKSAKKKYLKYLAIREGHKLSRKEKQDRKKAEREALKKERSNEEEGNDRTAGEFKNTLFLQFWSRSLDKLLAWRSASAMMFGQPLVFDMSYESNMSKREVENTVSQLLEVEGWNRRSTEPFHLHFCNLDPGGYYKKELLKRYGEETWDRLFVTSTHRQHVEVFPPEQLVYLTADSPNVLRTFDHSKVYIIGAMVDRSIQTGLSLANAKRLKLATARLPLDNYLQWEVGAKNLTLDQMIRIMLTMKDTGNWEEALKFVPKRKHDGFHREQMELVSSRAKDAKNYKPRQDNDRIMRFGDRNSGGTLKMKDRSFYQPQKESGFIGRDRMVSKREDIPASSKVRTSLKSTLEARKNKGKTKMWWGEE